MRSLQHYAIVFWTTRRPSFLKGVYRATVRKTQSRRYARSLD